MKLNQGQIDRMASAIISYAGPFAEPRVGWCGRDASHIDLYRCERCGAENKDYRLIEHSNGCGAKKLLDVLRELEVSILTPSQILEDGNGWFERGELPPVGIVVEYCGEDGAKDNKCYDEWKNGDHLEIIAIKKVKGTPFPVCFNLRHETASCMAKRYFRPIKSDRDKFVDAAVAAVCNAQLGLFDGNAMFFGALYDAGFKLPEGESDAKL